eukprot:comp21833_c0_seq1/m.31140 comp21833_c0_seq1/g.31140  ORF comp21833_c0_seq1/g.31140 comp21833_c0_seq1/m.31140 type:complete len:602 (-) comp21833_c0_seq1:116-1921(-)
MASRLGALGTAAGLVGLSRAAPGPLEGVGEFVPEARIVGGTELYTTPQWMASLRYPNSTGGMAHFCGGTLIADSWVLTAGHCLKQPPTSIQVWLGGNQRSDEDSFDKYDVVQAIRHEQWNEKLMNDLLLLKLDRPATTTATTNSCGYRKPIKLHTSADVPAGTKLEVIGWGVLQYGNTVLPEQLMQAQVPVVSLDTCRATPGLSGLITNNQFCAGYAEGMIDACTGDSGGPAFQYGPEGQDDVQWGITSWGDGCAKANRYGVYVNIPLYMDWITSNIAPDTLYAGTPPVDPGLKSFFTEFVGGSGKANVSPVLYFGFNCSSDCPSGASVAAVPGPTAAISCSAAGGAVQPSNVTATIVGRAGSAAASTTLNMLNDTRVTCGPASSFCKEIDFEGNGSTACNGSSSAAANRTICRVRVASLFPAGTNAADLAKATMQVTMTADSKALTPVKLDSRPVVSKMLGQWQTTRPTARTVVTSGLNGGLQESMVDSALITVTDIDSPARQLRGTWQMKAGTDTTQGDVYCVQTEESISRYAYTCSMLARANSTITAPIEPTALAFARDSAGQVVSLNSATNYVAGTTVTLAGAAYTPSGGDLVSVAL